MSFLLAWLAASWAGAQTVSVPIVAPVSAPVGVTGVAAVTFSPQLNPSPASQGIGLSRPLTLAPSPVLRGSVDVSLPAAEVSPRAALAGGVAAAAAPEGAVAIPATAKGSLSTVASELAREKRGGAGASFAPALGKAFDGAAVQLGSPSADPAPVDGVTRGGSARGPPRRALRSIERLKLGTYNMLNLFEKVGDHVPDPERPGKLKKVSDRVAKEEWQLREQAKAILESELDVVVAQEIENVRALEDFNQRYLGGAYRVHLIEGNDERGIDVAFLVKKDLPFEIEHRTHKEELWRDPMLGGEERRLFSRDLPSLIIRAEGEAKPLLVLLGTHFKSKRDRPGDRESETLRRAQVERAADIVGRYKAEFGEDVPLMLAGDFNGDLNREASFKPLWGKAGLTNSLDLGEAPVSAKDRTTHTYHPRGGPAHAAQMDGLLVSGGLKRLVTRSEIYRYRDARGAPRPIPRTYEERSRNPSDHFPLLVTLDFQPLVGRVLGPAVPVAPSNAGTAGLRPARPAAPVAAAGTRADPLAGLNPVMEFQADVLAAAARALGGDFTLVSMLMALLPDGPTLADWAALKARFEALGADRSELWAAVADAVGSAGLKGALADGRRPERGELDILPFALKEADRQLVILRNNRTLSWQHAWQRGDARAANASFEGASARLDGEDLHLDLGAVTVGKDKAALRVTLTLGVNGPGAAERFLSALAASPSFNSEHRRQLAPLVAELKSLGVVAAGFRL